jgi:hypothetical protein
VSNRPANPCVRRAKIKNIAKKSIESGEDCDGIPESMRRYLAMQAMESGKGIGRELLARNGSLTGFGGNSMFLNTDSNSSKVVIHHFSCRSLTVGSWRRIGQSAMDLVIFYSPDKCCVTYYINNDSAGYKIEYPFSYIKNISLEAGDPVSNAEGASHRSGGLVVELNRPPNFFMDSSGSGGFYQCGDFTEEQQASTQLIHHLGGHPKVLSGQLAKLVSLESFQKRHQPFDHSALAASAPVSPIVHRPASQPNHLVHPHHMGGMYPPSAFGQETFGPPRGHKRQRSRSVPVAVDLSMLRQPMPSFLIQHDQSGYNTPQHHEIHAPVPQYNHNGVGTPMGPNLSIDTSASYNMDFRQYPMSATTANSPSEYGTPALFSSAPQNETPNNFNNTPYTMPFMSPMADPSAIQHAPSPLAGVSTTHHADPVIANQSPPLQSMGRSGSADLYSMSHEHGNVSEDGLWLTDPKQMSLPFRSPMEGEGHDDLDLGNMVQFGTIDPSSLSPEKGGM